MKHRDINIALSYSQSGYEKFLEKDYFEAIDDYSKAMDLGDDDATCYLIRGIARMEVGQKKEGLIDLIAATECGHIIANDVIMMYLGIQNPGKWLSTTYSYSDLSNPPK